MNEKERLLKLLEYAEQAIIYWFDSVDCEDEVREENNHFQNECKCFINKLKSSDNN